MRDNDTELTIAEEDGLNSDFIDTKQSTSQNIRQEAECCQWRPIVLEVKGRQSWKVISQQEVASNAHHGSNDNLGDEQEEITEPTENECSDWILCDDQEGLPGTGQEAGSVHRHIDIGIPVDELDEHFQTPEATLHDTQQPGDHLEVSILLTLPVNILQHDSDESDHTDDE